MKDKDFEQLKQGFKEIADIVHGKDVPGTDEVLIKPRGKSTPIKPINMNLNSVDITKFRLSLNMSQEMFADVIGVSPSTVRAWEQGKRHPNQSIFRLITLIQNDPQRIKELVKLKVNA
ncbi:helix-turn-helix domain-containing protein [Lentilactobacillus otakiensis]|uniref:helix-turn-helix domain-containing protein n=1 Tax=Lentilactobacillus otakiensis TaxID=481720 RepID=UPI003D184BF7